MVGGGRRQRFPSMPLRYTFLGLSILVAVGLLAAWWLGFSTYIPLLSLIVGVALAINVGGVLLVRRGVHPRLVNWGVRLSNLALLTVGIHLSGGLTSPFIFLYTEDLLSASVRDGRRGARQGWMLVTLALLVLTLLSYPITLEHLVRFGAAVGALTLVALLVGEAGQQRLAIQEALARRTEEARRRAEQAEALYHATQALGASLDLQTVLQEVLGRAVRLLQLSRGGIILLDEDGEHWYHTDALWGYEGILARRIRETRGTVSGLGQLGEQLWHRRQVVTVPDVARHPDLGPAVAEALEMGALLLVPLVVHDRVIGVMQMSDVRPRPFTDEEKRLALTFAGQAAIAIENARLYAELEERARQLAAAYQELQELDRRKTEFIQNVTHELRTPLAFIRGYVELLRDGGLGELTPEQQEKLSIVAAKVQLLANLVRDIVSLQRGAPRPDEMHEVSLVEIARHAIASAEAMAREVGITLRLEVSDHLPKVQADPGRIEEVFDNLLSNAIKFSPDGGAITVRIWREEGKLITAVADQGIGIPPEEHERIFERFYQVDGSSTRRFGGTGLGLAIVKEVVEGHGGEVWVESAPGRGSTFYFTLPLAAPLTDTGSTQRRKATR